MVNTIVGLENEYLPAFSGPRSAALLNALFAAVMIGMSKVIPAVPFIEGPRHAGLMLGNAARPYPDGAYLEYAGPEALDPKDVVAHQRAGELLMLKALSLASLPPGITPQDVTFLRAATDYQSNHFGTHVNVSCVRFNAADIVHNLVPFAATRPFANAGGFGPGGFQMSQKSASVEAVASDGSRTNRALINLRREPLGSAQYKRLHMTHQDACMSELGVYLTVATWALVIRMLDDGAHVGASLALEDPIGALRQLDSDPTYSTPLRLACGSTATGLQIQKHYLRAAEAYVKGRGVAWMDTTVARWRFVLQSLESNPAALSTSLDPYIKYRVYSRMLAKNGMTMAEFGKWCGVLTLLNPHLGDGPVPHRSVRARVRAQTPAVTFGLAEERMSRNRLSWSSLPRARQIWLKMLVADLDYHSIRPDGLYWRLRNVGAVNSRVVDDAAIAHAMEHPPLGTRAERRGKEVKNLAGTAGASATWDSVRALGRILNLPDPFKIDVEWKTIEDKRNLKR